ncbi:response regulator [Asticcacaulis sp. 201]|uniref:response regulator n=1 Tax=Asticcacaulis sp. 201 TaxID=3028787 RepID=UPI002915F1D1|nr:response regulator [Asticcacaulis sp. 201]MDV6332262.1 response regulator [Asticcacaulis sp. 201]
MLRVFGKHSDKQKRSDLTTSLGLSLVGVFFIISGIISYANIQTIRRDTVLVTQTHIILISLNELLSTVKDAETGQRGYVITGDDAYLDPYNNATTHIDEQFTKIGALVKDDPEQVVRLNRMRELINGKMAELARTIELRRTGGLDAAVAVVKESSGKVYMDQIRSQVMGMQAVTTQRREQRIAEMNDAYKVAQASVTIAAVIGILLSAMITWMISRASAARRREEWLQVGQVGLSAAMMGEQRLDQLGNSVLTFLSEYTGAHAGTFFALTDGRYARMGTVGVPEENDVPATFSARDGLLGQAVSTAKPIILRDVTETHLAVGAGLGKWRPRHLLIAPAKSERMVDGVVELGYMQPIDDRALELLERVSETISVAVQSANYRAHLQNLLEETQRQSEELQSQGEELRVNNEELEEQSRALKESHFRLEQQQAELEQTNSQLEEQAAALESQKNDLSRSRGEIELKARELEQASRYKSDFLANMSHELRTPLNSSLILAKLLGDNPDGNLTEEQVKFARTIQSSGNDLLALINDILDLSKIEAGQMDIRPEALSLTRLVKDMQRVFDPVAEQKGLTFKVRLAKNLPDTIDTDRQRVEQVLKNLLSNAFKFTETGSVELAISLNSDGRIVMAVNDTGIGISDDQQAAIFEAFRQADGTISRKYGGTGLGLSISRELARLLGGAIGLKSAPGKGSSFALTLPLVYDAANVTSGMITPFVAPADSDDDIAILPPPPTVAAKTAGKTTKGVLRPGRVQDDRDRLDPKRRIILVVEDDVSFAGILYDLARDQSFQCLVATSAEEALEMVQQYTPHAVVLDIGLPDHSGLSVLDRLKRDNRTRHIPVHVVSGSDYQHTALSLGAVGYMLKPVKRDELVDAFKSLEGRLSQQMRRVLIVEDDEVQRDSVSRLLKSNDTETVAVGTAAECLEQLKEHTFDCMVLDLSLPDATGYSLLETLSHEDAYAFPPVIVYTGRDLSYEDEQRLRRYSSSIIIKGAKSPERLLDEVTLFLHQVVSELSPEQQTLLKKAKSRDAMLEGRRILIVEDDVRNVYAVTNIFEPLGAIISIARNGREALDLLEKTNDRKDADTAIDLVLMDVMMPEMDGLTATREIRKRADWAKLPVIMLTAKAMKDDQERCLDAGANDYMAKPLDVEKLISLVRVWMPR